MIAEVNSKNRVRGMTSHSVREGEKISFSPLARPFQFNFSAQFMERWIYTWSSTFPFY
jgi:hypothetical protein